MCWLSKLFEKKNLENYELPSPKIRVKPEQVTTSENEQGATVTISGLLKGSHVITVAPTNSLDPFIDDGMLVILEPFDGKVDDLIVGDIIDYALPFVISGFGGAFHRIVEIGQDAQGWWCKTKGDNPVCVVDPAVVRREYIRRLYRGVLT